ncbi:MAG: hypothetical protein DMF99_17215 [Acidobacteria bacterium]|nr:MAG: hypothetical protein DMF99_17215 [Acidobacteriota bacterium]
MHAGERFDVQHRHDDGDMCGDGCEEHHQLVHVHGDAERAAENRPREIPRVRRQHDLGRERPEHRVDGVRRRGTSAAGGSVALCRHLPGRTSECPSRPVHGADAAGLKRRQTTRSGHRFHDVSAVRRLHVVGAIQRRAADVSDAKSRGMRVFLATIPPENPAGFRALAWSLVPGFNDQIRLLASSEGVTLVDIHQAFNNDLSLIGADGLHPNANGYHKIADTFFASLRQQLEVSPGPTPTALPNILPTRR